ncbi:MAG: acyl-CoA dehydrogenase family protein [Thermoprotei archaeon]
MLILSLITSITLPVDEETTEKVVRTTARRFADSEIESIASKIDKDDIYPLDLIRKMGKEGYLGMMAPQEYGGSPMDMLSYSIVIEEFSYSSAAIGIITEVHNSLVEAVISKYGTNEQKERYLPKLASGEMIGAFALTEPGGGSDAANLKLKATRVGNEYVLNGTKIFITNAAYADLFIVFARTGRQEDKHKGISAFIVERNTKGFKVGNKIKTMGIRGTGNSELIFEDAEVPSENLLLGENQGFKIAMDALNDGRITVAAISLGLARRAFDESFRYALQREAFGKPIAEHEAISFMLADMATEIELTRSMLYRVAKLRDKGIRCVKEISMIKLYAAQMAMRLTNMAVQIHGGYGYSSDFIVERLFRDAKLMQIGEGTDEIQKMVIYKELLRASGQIIK